MGKVTKMPSARTLLPSLTRQSENQTQTLHNIHLSHSRSCGSHGVDRFPLSSAVLGAPSPSPDLLRRVARHTHGGSIHRRRLHRLLRRRLSRRLWKISLRPIHVPLLSSPRLPPPTQFVSPPLLGEIHLLRFR